MNRCIEAASKSARTKKGTALTKSIIGKFLFERLVLLSLSLSLSFSGECTWCWMKNGLGCLLVLFLLWEAKTFFFLVSVERKIIKTIYFLAIWCNLLLFVVIIDLGDVFFSFAPVFIHFKINDTIERIFFLFVFVCVDENKIAFLALYLNRLLCSLLMFI